MLKIVFALMVLVSVGMVQAQECAVSINELQDITRDPHLPLRWVETTESSASRVLTLTLGNAGDKGMSLRLTLPNGQLWADFKGRICKGQGEHYYAVVNKNASVWGPGAPGFVKFFGKPSRVTLDLTNKTRLKVEASKYKGTYKPI